MFNSLNANESDSESVALSISNHDDDDQDEMDNRESNAKKPKLIESLSSNIKDKLQKKQQFQRIDTNDNDEDDIDDVDNGQNLNDDTDDDFTFKELDHYKPTNNDNDQNNQSKHNQINENRIDEEEEMPNPFDSDNDDINGMDNMDNINFDDNDANNNDNNDANNNDNNENQSDASYSDLQQKEEIEFTQINFEDMQTKQEQSNEEFNDNDYNNINGDDNDLSEESLNDGIIEEDIDEIELSAISNDDDGDGQIIPHKHTARNKLENTVSFCVSLKSIFCHLMTMIMVSFTQIMVSSALYIIVPLHVRDTLKGGEILTGLIFMNYGFAYFSLTLFGSMFTEYYGSSFTILISIILSSLGLLFMTIFTDYFVWLMMLFVQGIAFALFTIGTQNFVIDNISIKSRKSFTNLVMAFNKIAMICGCVYAGHAIQDHDIVTAMGVTMGLSLTGIIFLCTLSIPPKFNENSSLVTNDSQHEIERGNNEDRIITKASISAWKHSYQQLSMKQRFSPFSWIKNPTKSKDVDDFGKGDHTPTYDLDDELNTLQVFKINMSTLLSIGIFSFGLTFVRVSRLLLITFKCMEVEGLTQSDIGYINGMSFLPEFFLYYLARYILHHYGRRWTLFTSFLLFIISLFSLPYCNDKQSLTYIAVLFGIANGCSFGLIHKVAIDIAPTENRDKFMNIYQTLTNFAWIVAPIFIAGLTEVRSSIETAAICCAVIAIISSFWSLCIMTDPKRTGKRYEQLDFEKSYGGNDELSLQDNGLINGKHIGRPIRYSGKMQLHSIDSVMEQDSMTAGNDTVAAIAENKIDINKFRLKGADHDNKSVSSDSDEENTNNNNDDYVERIANKGIGDLNLGMNMKFEIGHFDEEEEEESINYQLSSSDED